MRQKMTMIMNRCRSIVLLLYVLVALFLVSPVTSQQEASSSIEVIDASPRTAQQQQQIDETESLSIRPSSQRRELGFWSLLFLADLVHGCPPIGPPHDKCVQKKNASGGDSSSSSASASSSSSSSYSSNSAASDASSGSSVGGVPVGKRSLTMWMIVIAAGAAAMAMAAVMMGMRKSEKKPHALTGSVARRMELFSNFANCALMCSDADARPARVVEMTASHDDFDYRHGNANMAMV